ncbi:hypothetical protein ACH5RR_002613 [Cinchona calisaya]|uniref:E3 ubiquitin-protein ligase RMA n=1 Tax=Cinchona calisaya TaxID=153742 RepID=A0ABD3ASG5_9GENT
MGDGMNLDLNLGPIDHSSENNEPGMGSFPDETLNLGDWLDDGPVNRAREPFRQRRQRWRSVWRQFQMPLEARNIALELIGGSGLQAGEGSIGAEEVPVDEVKTCENNNGFLENDALGKKDDDEKANSDAGSFFDCNVCLDLAKDPVVTCCGHLFCWPCLYRWLHVHSDAKECPVCKGEVTIKDVTPIYGRGKNARQLEDDSNLKIPLRPKARRVESLRQTIQRAAFTIPMEEMIRRLTSRYDLTQVQPHNADASRDSPERSNSLLNRILTSRGMRREQNNVISPDDVVDLTQSSPTNLEVSESRRISPLLLRRSNSNQAAISHLTSALSSAERLVESYFPNNPLDRTLEQSLTVDDRDSISSIAAVIHSESQTVDTAVEIDSTVSLSTSSSRRRNDASRVSDVDSEDSRAYRRRRLG